MFCVVFSELWLDWIQDEMKFNEDREEIYKLFERAVEDYLSNSRVEVLH